MFLTSSKIKIFKEILAVSAGAIAGGLFRYILSALLFDSMTGLFLSNVLGSFLIGILMPLITSEYLKYFVGTGFLGAFTSYSSFIAYSVDEKSVLYMFGTLLMGFLAAMFGFYCSFKMIERRRFL